MTAELRRSPGGASVLVRISSDVTTPGGKVVKRDREHFRATVLLGRGRTARTDVPAAAGIAVGDPYYRPDSRVVLSGVFRATDEAGASATAATARWRPGPLPDAFSRQAIPGLLLDGLARVLALPPLAGNVQEVKVPRYFRRIELYTEDNDAALAARWPEGIALHWNRWSGVLSAVAPDGTLLVTAADVQSASMGLVPAEPGEKGDR